MTSRKSNADSFNSLAAARWPSLSTATQLYIVEYSQSLLTTCYLIRKALNPHALIVSSARAFLSGNLRCSKISIGRISAGESGM
jgi:hypothetical protein